MAENSQPTGAPSMAGQPVLECNSGFNNLFHCRNHIIGKSWLEIDGLEIFVGKTKIDRLTVMWSRKGPRSHVSSVALTFKIMENNMPLPPHLLIIFLPSINTDQQSCNCRSTYSITTRVLYQAVSLDWMVRIAVLLESPPSSSSSSSFPRSHFLIWLCEI